MKQVEVKSEVWPNFLIIGAGKCGTTSIDFYLKQHPEIFMSPVKEPNFFGLELLSEEHFNYDEKQLDFFRSSITDRDDYLALFEEVKEEKALGEVSNTYLYHEHAGNQIKKHIPDVKLIAIFRQPAERLYSRYLHLARDQELPTSSFSDCLDKNTIWWERDDLVKEGFYFKHLSKFYDLFDESRIKVFLYEDLNNNTESVLKEIFEFLEVDSGFSPDTSIRYNPSGFIKNKYYDRLIGADGMIKKALKSVMNDDVFEKFKFNPLVRRMVTKIHKSNLEKPKLDETLKRQVTDIYKQDIEQLSLLINRDLSHWLK